MTDLERQVRDCPDCRVLNENSSVSPDKVVWTLQNGMRLDIGYGNMINLWSDYLVCAKHDKALRRAYPADAVQ